MAVSVRMLRLLLCHTKAVVLVQQATVEHERAPFDALSSTNDRKSLGDEPQIRLGWLIASFTASLFVVKRWFHVLVNTNNCGSLFHPQGSDITPFEAF